MTRVSMIRCICASIIVAYMVASCAAFYFGELIYRIAATTLGCVLFAIMAARHQKKELFVVVGMCLLVACVALVNAEWSEFRSVFLLFVLLACVGVSWAAFEMRLTKIAFEYLFVFFLGLTFYLVVFLGYGAKEFNVFLSGSSRNVYSALMLASAMGYVLSIIFRGKRPSLVLMLAFVLLSYPLYGRTAIAFSIVFSLLVLSLYYRKSSIVVGVFGVIGGVLIGGAAVSSGLQFSSYAKGTNFESGLESERFDMLAQYWERLELNGVVLGQDFTDYPAIKEKGGNPHNAFLRLHGYWGGGLLILFAVFLYSLVVAFGDGRVLIILIALMALARAFFDIVYLFNLFDYLFFPAVFYFFFRGYFQGGANSSGVSFR